jgi:GWxTD domain-containing protein
MRYAPPIGLAAALAVAVLLLLPGCLSARPGTEEAARYRLAASTSEAEAALTTEQIEVALREGDPVSPRLLDLYIERALPEAPDAPLLWEAYRRMLVSVDRYEGDTAHVHLERHLVLAELLYTDAPPREAGLRARAARALRWWTESEAAPASGENERLVAHLERVAKARQHYPSPTSTSGLDDRGETLVRYGEPSRSRRVDFNEADLLRSFMRDGIPVRSTDFPANEFWIYDQFGYSGNFLFVRRGQGEAFSHGTVNDLLPRQFRTRGVTGSVRSASFANAALRTLRYIFSQLALFHPVYSSRYDSIAEYVAGRRSGR